MASMMQKYGHYKSVQMRHPRFHAYQNTLHKKEITEYIHFIEKF